VKRFLAFLIIMLCFTQDVFAGREYLLKYAYPKDVKTKSIYDLLGKGKNYKNAKSRNTRILSSIKDKVPPKVVYTYPSNEANNVDLNVSIRIKFSENIRKGVNFSKIYLKRGNEGERFSIALSKNEVVLKASLKPDSVYTVYIPKEAFLDYSNNKFLGYSFSFKTKQLIAKTYLNSPFSLIMPNVDFSDKDFNYDSGGEYLFFDYIKRIKNLNYVKMEGIPFVYEGNQKKFNPLLCAEYGLQEFTFYKNGDLEAFKGAKSAADYLILHQQKDGSFINDFNYKEGNIEMKEKWKSDLTQGMAISLFIRLYKETLDEKYLNAAKLSLKPLLNKSVYDMFDRNSKYTLSSHMFVLFGLYDLSFYSPEALLKFNEGVETLKKILPDMFENEKFYEDIQIAQIKALNSILEDPYFEEFLVDVELLDVE